MSARLATLAVALFGSCVPRYEAPSPEQPHAIVKLRRIYDTTAGTHLAESVDIDEHDALRETAPAAVARAPLTDSLLVHPVPSTLHLRSNFLHYETQLVNEAYQEPYTTYRTESYSCSSGFGANVQYRMCTRSVPHTEYRTRHRMVSKTVAVSDGSCERLVRFSPQTNHVYLVQYTYQADGACDLSCYEQIAAPDGAFRNLPCPAAPPEP